MYCLSGSMVVKAYLKELGNTILCPVYLFLTCEGQGPLGNVRKSFLKKKKALGVQLYHTKMYRGK